MAAQTAAGAAGAAPSCGVASVQHLQVFSVDMDRYNLLSIPALLGKGEAARVGVITPFYDLLGGHMVQGSQTLDVENWDAVGTYSILRSETTIVHLGRSSMATFTQFITNDIHDKPVVVARLHSVLVLVGATIPDKFKEAVKLYFGPVAPGVHPPVVERFEQVVPLDPLVAYAIPVRPTDEDFNFHVNQRMYAAFVISALEDIAASPDFENLHFFKKPIVRLHLRYVREVTSKSTVVIAFVQGSRWPDNVEFVGIMMPRDCGHVGIMRLHHIDPPPKHTQIGFQGRVYFSKSSLEPDQPSKL